jgi:hypothetical protein
MPTRETETFRNLDTDSRTSTPVSFSLGLLEQKTLLLLTSGPRQVAQLVQRECVTPGTRNKPGITF